MTSYYDLSIYPRALLMLALFVTASLALVAFLVTFRRKWLISKISLPLCSIVCGGLTAFFASEARAAKFSRPMPWLVDKVCELPILLSFLALVACGGFTVYICVREGHTRKKRLSRDSIKESLDKLPTGLCFYRENGRIILVNYSMNELCHSIVGRDLQNAKLFWEILSKGEALPEIERLEWGEHPSFRLKNGRVYSFSRMMLEGVYQLVAADTTELSNVNAQLKAGNAELSEINARLREYGEQVDQLTRMRERIDIKAGIHRELGQALLVTRRYILDGSDNSQAPIYIWKKNVAMLIREADLTAEDTLLSDFLHSAHSAGVKVELSGELPEDKKQNALCMMAAVECLVNGVRHADANTLYITVTEGDGEISVTYENDGALPEGEIIEGGGLSSLRHRANRLGGRTEVRATPKFSLTVILPKEGGSL